MKKTSKALLLVLCAVLLVTASVMGTMAYLTANDTVVNTFSVGKVAITLDETEWNEYGEEVKESEGPVEGNEYKLIPGHTYSKDPTIHVLKGSEPCYLFVRVENGIKGIEAETNTIENQMVSSGWSKLKLDGVEVENVYFYAYKVDGLKEQKDVLVFEEFTISGTADVDKYDDASITVTAYAIQADGFNSEAAAWGAYCAQNPST